MKSKFFVFILSASIYLCYFAGLNPGYYSRDVMDYIREHARSDSLLDSFYLCLPHSLATPASFFYRVYILMFYLITKNLVALGFFQVLLVSAINTYCWDVLKKFSNTKIAWIVTLLMIFSPINGIMTAWYHRSSLFGWLVGLNLILLYKFSKIHRFERLEKIIFLTNLLLVSFLRIDGIIISLSSLVIFLLKIRDRKRVKIGVLAGFVLILTIYILGPAYRFPNSAHFFVGDVNPQLHLVRRVHQATALAFTAEDLKALNQIFRSESDRKIWFEKEGPEEHNYFIKDQLSQTEFKNFTKWSSLFMVTNLPHWIKAQTKEFFNYPNRPLYFHSNNPHKDQDYYLEVKEKINVSDNPYIKFPAKIVEFIEDAPLSGTRGIFVILIVSIYIPFVFIFIYFAVALIRDRDILIPIASLLLYSIYLFLIQPVAILYYWYWLSYSYYFIVFALYPRYLNPSKIP